MNVSQTLAAMVLGATSTTALIADELYWANWRGPDGTGYLADGNPPIEWSEDKNIGWKVAIPGDGYASPIVVGDHIYLLTAIETDRKAAGAAAGDGDGEGRRGRGPSKPTNFFKFQAIAVDRTNGEIVWTTTLREEVPHEGKHQTSSFAPNSAVSDGEHIIAHFGSRGIFCLDMHGKVVWEKDLGDMRIRNSFGEGASAVLHGDVVVVPWDHEGDSFVVALNKRTGDELWRKSRDEPTTWATPVITEVAGEMQVILSGTNNCMAYDLKTGKEVWRSEGLTTNAIPTPMIAHGNVYLMSGFRGAAVLVINLAKAKGDVSGTDAVVWRHNRGTPYVPSGMLAGERLYFLGSNTGILSCFNAITGEQHYAGERLGALGNVYASIVGAGGYLFVCGREGDIAVVREGPDFELIRTNKLGEGINASPAIVGDTMYIRGDQHLYCIRADPAAGPTPRN